MKFEFRIRKETSNNTLKGICYIPSDVKTDKWINFRIYIVHGNPMLDNPDITIEGLATAAGISVAAVNKQLRQLLNKGYIQRSESDGSWRIFASSSI